MNHHNPPFQSSSSPADESPRPTGRGPRTPEEPYPDGNDAPVVKPSPASSDSSKSSGDSFLPRRRGPHTPPLPHYTAPPANPPEHYQAFSQYYSNFTPYGAPPPHQYPPHAPTVTTLVPPPAIPPPSSFFYPTSYPPVAPPGYHPVPPPLVPPPPPPKFGAPPPAPPTLTPPPPVGSLNVYDPVSQQNRRYVDPSIPPPPPPRLPPVPPAPKTKVWGGASGGGGASSTSSSSAAAVAAPAASSLPPVAVLAQNSSPSVRSPAQNGKDIGQQYPFAQKNGLITIPVSEILVDAHMTTIESKTNKKSKYASHRGVPTSVANEMPLDVLHTAKSSYPSLPPPPPAPPTEKMLEHFIPPPPQPPRMPPTPYGSSRAPTPPRIQEASFCDVLTPKTPRTPGHLGFVVKGPSTTSPASGSESSSKKRHREEEAEVERAERKRQRQREEEEERKERHREKERRRQQRELDRKEEERKKVVAPPPLAPPPPPPIVPKEVVPTIRALPMELFAAPKEPEATPKAPKPFKMPSRHAFRTGKPVRPKPEKPKAVVIPKQSVEDVPSTSYGESEQPKPWDSFGEDELVVYTPVAPEDSVLAYLEAQNRQEAFLEYVPGPTRESLESTSNGFSVPDDGPEAPSGGEEPVKKRSRHRENGKDREAPDTESTSNGFSVTDNAPEVPSGSEEPAKKPHRHRDRENGKPASESAPESESASNGHSVTDDAPEQPSEPIKKRSHREDTESRQDREIQKEMMQMEMQMEMNGPNLGNRMAFFRTRMSKECQEKFDPLVVDRAHHKKKKKEQKEPQEQKPQEAEPVPQKPESQEPQEPEPVPQEPEPQDPDDEYIDVVGGADEPVDYEPIVFEDMEPMEQESMDQEFDPQYDPQYEEPMECEPMEQEEPQEEVLVVTDETEELLEQPEGREERREQEPEQQFTEEELLGEDVMEQEPEPKEPEPEPQEPEKEKTPEKTPEKEKTPEVTETPPTVLETPAEQPSTSDQPSTSEQAPSTSADAADADAKRKERSPSLEIIDVCEYSSVPSRPRERRKRRRWARPSVDSDECKASDGSAAPTPRATPAPLHKPMEINPAHLLAAMNSNANPFKRARKLLTNAALKMGVAPPLLPHSKKLRESIAPGSTSASISPTPLAPITLPRSDESMARIQERRAAQQERFAALDAQEKRRLERAASKTTETGFQATYQKLIQLEQNVIDDTRHSKRFREESVRRMNTITEQQASRERSLRGESNSSIASIASTSRVVPGRAGAPSPSPGRESMSSKRSRRSRSASGSEDSEDTEDEPTTSMSETIRAVRRGEKVHFNRNNGSLAGIAYPARRTPSPKKKDNVVERTFLMNPSVDQRHEVLTIMMNRQQLNGAAKNSMGQGVLKHLKDEEEERKKGRGHRRVHPDFEKSKRDAEMMAGMDSAGTSNRNLKMLSNKYRLPKMQCKFRKYIRVWKHPNGGASVLKCDYNQIRKEFTTRDLEKFCRQFCRLGFSEHRGSGVFSIVIMENGASMMSDLFGKIVEETNGQLQVKVGSLTNKQLIETMGIRTYQNLVHETYENGTFRVGPLMAVSTVGAKQEEAGGHFKEFLKELDTHPFTGPMMPWGEFSELHKMPPPESDDGPILWVRPGEQMVPMTETRRNNDAKHPLSTRHAERREVEFLDRTPCHADQVDDKETVKRSTAAVGVLQGIRKPGDQPEKYEDWMAEERQVVKEVVVFHAADLHAVVNNLGIDLYEPPAGQCSQWVEEAKLNSMRRQGVRYAKLDLKENDMYFLPRNVVHQFRTVSACTSVAWHVRLKHYYYPKEKSSIDDRKEFMCDSDYSDDGNFNG